MTKSELDRIAASASKDSRDLVTRTDPPRTYHMRIARDGTWFHEGGEIKRIELVKLFSTVLKRDAEGKFWLITPVERGEIEVEDAPFVAVDMDVEGEEDGENQRLIFRTNLDHVVEAGPDHPIRVATDDETGEPSPYILIKDGLEALINRAVFYRLADLAVERHDEETDALVWGVWSNQIFFPIGAEL